MIGLLMLAGITFFTGNDLYEGICGEKGDRAACSLYVAGAVDEALGAHAISSKSDTPGIFCLPAGATVAQVGDVYRKYLAEHPADRSMMAPIIVLVAMKDAFPCRKQGG